MSISLRYKDIDCVGYMTIDSLRDELHLENQCFLIDEIIDQT